MARCVNCGKEVHICDCLETPRRTAPSETQTIKSYVLRPLETSLTWSELKDELEQRFKNTNIRAKLHEFSFSLLIDMGDDSVIDTFQGSLDEFFAQIQEWARTYLEHSICAECRFQISKAGLIFKHLVIHIKWGFQFFGSSHGHYIKIY